MGELVRSAADSCRGLAVSGNGGSGEKVKLNNRGAGQHGEGSEVRSRHQNPTAILIARRSSDCGGSPKGRPPKHGSGEKPPASTTIERSCDPAIPGS